MPAIVQQSDVIAGGGPNPLTFGGPTTVGNVLVVIAQNISQDPPQPFALPAGWTLVGKLNTNVSPPGSGAQCVMFWKRVTVAETVVSLGGTPLYGTLYQQTAVELSGVVGPPAASGTFLAGTSLDSPASIDAGPLTCPPAGGIHVAVVVSVDGAGHAPPVITPPGGFTILVNNVAVFWDVGAARVVTAGPQDCITGLGSVLGVCAAAVGAIFAAPSGSAFLAGDLGGQW